MSAARDAKTRHCRDCWRSSTPARRRKTPDAFGGASEASRQFRRSLSAKRHRRARRRGAPLKTDLARVSHGFAMSLSRAASPARRERGRDSRGIYCVTSCAKNARTRLLRLGASRVISTIVRSGSVFFGARDHHGEEMRSQRHDIRRDEISLIKQVARSRHARAGVPLIREGGKRGSKVGQREEKLSRSDAAGRIVGHRPITFLFLPRSYHSNFLSNRGWMRKGRCARDEEIAKGWEVGREERERERGRNGVRSLRFPFTCQYLFALPVERRLIQPKSN